ncbi:MAG: hypothetical protein ISS16_02160 [Ignavibacteria bacterium]|nr:hypothetical protein [Ignavibacteria bacterium]
MRTKQVRPDKLKYEYELSISHQFDTVLKKKYILFDFRTVKIFENFVYRINVIENINFEKKELNFDVEGLSAPKISLPNTGNAGYQFKLYDFKNTTYMLDLTKHKKKKCKYEFKVTTTSVKLMKKPPKTFIKVLT